MITLSLVSVDNNTEYPVSGLKKPIRIGIPTPKNQQIDESKVKCEFRNKTSNKWESSGCDLVVTLNSLSNSTEYICECNHLTEFTLISLSDFVSVYENSNIRTFGEKPAEFVDIAFWKSPIFIAQSVELLIAAMAFLLINFIRARLQLNARPNRIIRPISPAIRAQQSCLLYTSPSPRDS
eukprot:TRINITY_DN22664_c0_g1_i1.p1 TRINITY_DN22664_c0_g1~~TRINITY_DN22664_c0_g1_i1.p1  ORF type:complete len:180 (+),score=19.54 TRINITY_DN22664_c0_g1_i1:235-774(+)